MHFSCSVRQVQFTIQNWKKDWSNTSHLEIFFLFSFFFSVHGLPFSKIFKQLQLLLPLLGRCPEFRYSYNNVHPRFWYYWLLAYEKLDIFSFFFFLLYNFYHWSLHFILIWRKYFLSSHGLDLFFRHQQQNINILNKDAFLSFSFKMNTEMRPFIYLVHIPKSRKSLYHEGPLQSLAKIEK